MKHFYFTGDDTYIAQKIIGKGGNAKVYMVSIFDLGCCDDRQENMALKVTSVIQQFT